MARRESNPISLIPSPARIRKKLAEAEAQIIRLRLLLEASEEVSLPASDLVRRYGPEVDSHVLTPAS